MGIAVLAPTFSSLAEAMPENARQSLAGYWIGAEPTIEDVPALAEAGIHRVVSAVFVNAEHRRAYEAAGITHVHVRITNRFPDVDEFLDAIEGFEASEIYMHCDWGGDRAGIMLAFVLVMLEEWRPDHAILSVAIPAEYHLRHIRSVLEEFGLVISAEEQTEYAGIYSGISNGGTGGLKGHTEDYRNLIRTTLQSMSDMGVAMDETPTLTDADVETVRESGL